MKRNLTLILFAFLPLTLTACGAEGSAEVTTKDDFGVTGVHIVSAKELFLTRGERSAVEADVSVKSEEVDKTLVWKSTNPYIASVDSNGVITAGQTSGECVVSAISVIGGFSDQVKVHVTAGSSSEIADLKFSITSHTFKGLNADPIEIIPTINPSTISIDNINYTNSDEKVAKFEKTENGIKVTPLAYGETTIVGKVGQKTAKCAITVENPDAPDPSKKTITLKETHVEMKIDASYTVVAEVTGIQDIEPLEFTVSNPDVLKVNGRTGRTITVKALKSGDATVTAKFEEVTATCEIHVTEEKDDYGAFCATFSKPGHVYLHYLRTSDQNYDPWAVWMWQKVPEDSEGTLWGATHSGDLLKAGITSVTTSWMTGDDVKKGGSDVWQDANGQIVDIDVTRTDLKGGKTGVATSFRNEDGDYCSRVGFLIVDQTKMTGGSHWKSDGGIEAYIKKFNESTMLDNGNKAVHIFCIEGQVTSFTTTSGAAIEVNPTVTDTTGQYRSKTDITDLKRDLHKGQASPTSTTFVNDRPGVGYQVFVPAFADSDGDGLGDIGGIIAKLDEGYFTDLGVGVLWLTPVQESGSYHGYDVTNYYEIDPKFGTMEQYKELINKAHNRGIKVLMDMVINHTSKNNVLFTESQKAGTIDIKGQQVNARDLYLWKFKGDKIREWNGQEVAQGAMPTYVPMAVENSEDWYQDGSSNYYYYGKFGSGMAELNYSYQATRTYMQEMCKWWLAETGLDGFRLDAIKHIYLESEISVEDASKYASDAKCPDASYRDYYDDEKKMDVHAKNDYTYDIDLNVKFWKEFAWEIKSEFPNCFLVGENFDGWNARIAPFYESMDSQFDFSTYYHLNEMAPASIGSDIQTTLNLNRGYGQDAYKKDLTFKRDNAINGAYTSNHDISRMMNHASGALVGATTHYGDVNASNLSRVTDRAKYAAAVTLLTPGVSWVYYGDEIGLTGNVNDKDPGEEDHGNNVDRWYRQPMKWTTEMGASDGTVQTTNYGFGGLKVKWDSINKTLATASAQASNPSSMLSHFKLLGKTKADPRYPTYGWINWAGTIGSTQDSCAMQISDGTRTVNVFINNSGSVASIPYQDQMANVVGCSQGGSKTSVPAHGFVVLSN